jgi:hypothetical protein
MLVHQLTHSMKHSHTEELIFAQMVYKFPTFQSYGGLLLYSQGFTTGLYHQPDDPHNSTPTYTVSVRFTLILFCYFRLCPPLDFRTTILCRHLRRVCYMSYPSRSLNLMMMMMIIIIIIITTTTIIIVSDQACTL